MIDFEKLDTLYLRVKEVLDTAPPCCLYCENTYRSMNEKLTLEDYEKIDKGEVLREELVMRASLPHDKFNTLHCYLYQKFVDKKHCCISFKYRCSIIQKGYEYKKRKEKKQVKEVVQLSLF